MSSPRVNAFAQDLWSDGARLRIGDVSVELKVDSKGTAIEVAHLYADYPKESTGKLCDHEITVSGTLLRRRNYYRGLVNRQIVARINCDYPFKAFPKDHALPVIESALNWCVARSNCDQLMLHAAVAELDRFLCVMPGVSGAGKSTLCAALVSEGWRLLSDEFALVRLEDGRIQPHPRPISLKNESIDLIDKRYKNVDLSRVYPETAKGRVAFMRAPTEAVMQAEKPGKAAFIVFPNFTRGAELTLRQLERARSFERLMQNAANYRQLMKPGFDTLCDLVEKTDHYELRYGDLDDAVACLVRLVRAESKRA